MRVGVYPADAGGCGHYRMIWPAEALQRAGHDITIMGQDNENAMIDTVMQIRQSVWQGKVVDVEHVIGLNSVPEYDVIVLQRPLNMNLVQCIPFLQDAGVAVVVELDDDFEAIDPRNQVYASTHPKLNPSANWKWLHMATELADLVTVSTDSLAATYRKGLDHRPVVLRNYLPTHAYGLGPREDAPANIGWAGGINTHPHDLPMMGPSVARTGAQFVVVGTGKGVARQLGVGEARVEPGDWVPLDEYHAALDRIDIGVVPLDDTRFNRGKSWLKGLEYAARGIPFVASPLPEYNALAALGAGSLASKPKEWLRELRRLNDPPYYRDAAVSAYATAQDLCIDDHADKWWDAWSQARARRLAA